MTAFSKFITAHDTSVPKWKLALVASAGLMCGLAGYMYYRSKTSKPNLQAKVRLFRNEKVVEGQLYSDSNIQIERVKSM